LRSGVRLVRRAIGYGLLGAVVVLLLIYIVVLDRREDLELWHEVHLDEEYRQEGEVTDFEGYLELEDRLFKQLDE
jgi:hypothetical protein